MFPSWIKLLKNWKPEDKPRYQSDRFEQRVFYEGARRRRLAGILEYKEVLFEQIKKLPGEFIEALASLFATAGSVTQDGWKQFCRKQAAKLGLDPDSLLTLPFELGLAARFTRLKSDEKSIHSVVFGPTSYLLKLIEDNRKNTTEANTKWLRFMKKAAGASLPRSPSLDPDKKAALSAIRRFIAEKIEKIENANGYTVKLTDSLPWSFDWDKPKGKFHLALEFLLAVLTVAGRETAGGFEWKELGAAVDSSIGGSKRFDRDRDRLIALVEDIAQVPLYDLGLTSSGSLYSIYVLGDARLSLKHESGTPQSLSFSSLHALTNVEAEQLEGMSISAKRIILTENRALLLKMLKTGWFKKPPGAFVIGTDGRLRLGHRRFLKVLRESAPDTACFIWTDSDSPGLSFAKDLHRIFPDGRIVFIEGNTLHCLDYDGFSAKMLSDPGLLGKEQESFLGGPDDWDRVFTPAP